MYKSMLQRALKLLLLKVYEGAVMVRLSVGAEILQTSILQALGCQIQLK